MNLKEAFRLQNKLQSLMDEGLCILDEERNVLKRESTMLRKKVMPEAENETVVELPDSEFADRIDGVVDFVLMLLSEREKLSEAVCAAKRALPIDMDSQVGLNSQRQRVCGTLRRMSLLRNSERMCPGGGTGYRFNADGNQVVYRCDVKQVCTLNFNRNKVRAKETEVGGKAEEVSTELDRCLINSEVDYTAPFNVNDSFEEILLDFLEHTTTE